MTGYTVPDLDLLRQSEPSKKITAAEYDKRVAYLQKTLESYGVAGRVTTMLPGPAVSIYNFRPQNGVRIEDIRAIREDIARAMATDNRIIIAQVPYEPEVSIAIPNVQRRALRMGDLIFGDEFPTDECVIPWLMGWESAHYRPLVKDLTDMEHVLVAGCPEVGKSMLLQSLVLSVAYTCTPDFCKLVLIDTKGTTFDQCDIMPHLATPVAKNERDGVFALQTAVHEISNRLNQESADWPYWVVIIDEVADLMAMSRGDIEYITHYGARVGVHLVMATRYADGTPTASCIRAYVPTRVLFRTYTRMGSIQSLRTSGAENLLDYGDILISDKTYIPTRVQTALIDPDEIKRVMDFMCSGDTLYERAKACVLGAKRPTLTHLQRHLQIGYNKASELMERLKADGLVTVPDETGADK